MIFKQMSSTEIRKVAINQGMRTLYNDGIWKTIRGITTLDEVYKNAKRTEQDIDV
jgi:type IV pilus assembly protein PilB